MFKYLKYNLKMSKQDRFNLKLKNIFPNRDDDFDILYLRCQDQEDISLITSHAHNLSSNDHDNAPSIIPHIPSLMYKRYQECEKLLWHIRAKERGLNFLLRYKLRTDKTPWKLVPLMKIPDNIPKLETKAHKDILIADNTKNNDKIDQIVPMDLTSDNKKTTIM